MTHPSKKNVEDMEKIRVLDKIRNISRTRFFLKNRREDVPAEC